MNLIKRTLHSLYGRIYCSKITVMYGIFGIEYVEQALSYCPRHLITSILRRYGASIGRGVNFKDNIYIDNASGDQDARGDFSNLDIGNKCYIGKGVFFDLPDRVKIEDECAISAGVKIITHSDCGARIMSQWYPRQRGGVTIGYGSWIGVNAVILQGVELGKCCVVAAGSVVTQSFPDYSVVAGTPAKVVKTLKT